MYSHPDGLRAQREIYAAAIAAKAANSPAKRGESCTLGTYTKSLHAAPGNRGVMNPQKAEQKASANAGRYGLMRTAQGLLWKKTVEGWREQHRTCWCSRSFKTESAEVGVYRNNNGSGASITGLNRCGEIWTCPVCAAKIAEERRKELSAGLVKHLGNDGAAYLVTLTFPHEADHALSELLPRFVKARTKLQNSRTWKSTMQQAGRIGSVSALEITASTENGWHPHVHMLIFAKPNGFSEGEAVNAAGDLESPMIADIRRAWVNLLIKTGLGEQNKVNDMLKHALNVRGGNQAAEYIAKYGRDERWGLSSELTRNYAKQGAAGVRGGELHHTPFQLLTWAGNGDAWSIAKFCEYSEAIAGKRAITWSPGLKKLLGVGSDRTDEEIAADDQARPEQSEVGVLDKEQFQTLLKRNRLPDFMRYVASHAFDQSDLDDYITAISETPPLYGGAVLVKGTFHGRHMVN